MLARTCGLLLLIGLLGQGCCCSRTEKIRLTETGAPDFKRLELVYDVDSPGGMAFVGQPSAVRLAGETDASAAPAAGPEVPPEQRVRLEIQYPYPGVHAEFVHATLKVLSPATASPAPAGSAAGPGDSGSGDGGQGGTPSGPRGFSNANSRGGGLLSLTVGPPVQQPAQPGEEVLVIDLPKTELTAIFAEMADDGFFKKPPITDGKTYLAVTYNEGQVEKAWTREAALERLIGLIKQHGTATLAQPAVSPRRLF